MIFWIFEQKTMNHPQKLPNAGQNSLYFTPYHWLHTLHTCVNHRLAAFTAFNCLIIFSFFIITMVIILILNTLRRKNICNRLLQLTKSEHLIKLNKTHKKEVANGL